MPNKQTIVVGVSPKELIIPFKLEEKLASKVAMTTCTHVTGTV